MIDIELKVIKADVYDEVAKTTSYEAAKAVDDEEAYERVFTVDADQDMLERFWDEACSIASDTMKRFITSVKDTVAVTGSDGKTSTADGYDVCLSLSGSYDDNLTAGMQKSLRSFFVNAIVCKWDKFANKGSVKSYEEDTNAALDDIVSKMFYRKKPQRKAV